MALIEWLMKRFKPHFSVCHLIFTQAGLLKHVCQIKVAHVTHSLRQPYLRVETIGIF